MILLGDDNIVRHITIEHTKNPAPYNAPILYDIPPSEEEDTIAVITSPA